MVKDHNLEDHIHQSQVLLEI